MTTTRDELIIAEALAVVDGALQDLGGRQVFSSSEVADVLLDLRGILIGAEEPSPAPL